MALPANPDPTPQPVLKAATISALVSAVLALVVAFGVDLTPEQVAAVMGLAGVAGPLVAALWSRGKVTPV